MLSRRPQRPGRPHPVLSIWCPDRKPSDSPGRGALCPPPKVGPTCPPPRPRLLSSLALGPSLKDTSTSRHLFPYTESTGQRWLVVQGAVQACGVQNDSVFGLLFPSPGTCWNSGPSFRPLCQALASAALAAGTPSRVLSVCSPSGRPHPKFAGVTVAGAAAQARPGSWDGPGLRMVTQGLCSPSSPSSPDSQQRVCVHTRVGGRRAVLWPRLVPGPGEEQLWGRREARGGEGPEPLRLK